MNTKTEKPKSFGPKTEKPTEKIAKTVKPKIPMPLLLHNTFFSEVLQCTCQRMTFKLTFFQPSSSLHAGGGKTVYRPIQAGRLCGKGYFFSLYLYKLKTRYFTIGLLQVRKQSGIKFFKVVRESFFRVRKN